MYVDSQEPTVMVLLIVEDIQKSFTETLADSIWYSVMDPQLVSSQFIREMIPSLLMISFIDQLQPDM